MGSENINSQSNLFFSDIKVSYKKYFEKKVEYLKKSKLIKMDHKNLEEILATYFLIKNNIITEKKELNQIFSAALIQSIFELFHNKGQYKKNIVRHNIKRIYFDYYIFDQLKNLFALSFNKSDLHIESLLKLKKGSAPYINAVICSIHDYDSRIKEIKIIENILTILELDVENSIIPNFLINPLALSKRERDFVNQVTGVLK